MTDPAEQPTVLLVGGAGAVSSSKDIVGDALNQARRRGLRTRVINRPDLLAQSGDGLPAADQTSPVDVDNPAECVRWVQDRVAAGDRFDIVLGLRDSVVPSVASVSAALGLPGNCPDAVRRSQHKDECRATLAAAGFRQPRVRLCTSAADADAFLAEIAGPWVVKPRAGEGSIGVSLVHDPAQLAAAVGMLPSTDEFLVEEFVDGPEYSVEGVFLNGTAHVLAVTAKETAGFVEVAHRLPADLSPRTNTAIGDAVRRATVALGLRHGVFHVELWITRHGIVLGEVHPRPGGDWIHRLLNHARPNLEMFGLIYDDQLGRTANPVPPPTRAAASRYLIPPPGRLIGVAGWARVARHPHVLHAELSVRPGDVLSPVTASGDRSGVVLVGADTLARARSLAAELAASVRFKVEPVREKIPQEMP